MPSRRQSDADKKAMEQPTAEEVTEVLLRGDQKELHEAVSCDVKHFCRSNCRPSGWRVFHPGSERTH